MANERIKMGDGSKGDHMMMCRQVMKARMEMMVELLELTGRRKELRKGSVKADIKADQQ